MERIQVFLAEVFSRAAQLCLDKASPKAGDCRFNYTDRNPAVQQLDKAARKRETGYYRDSLKQRMEITRRNGFIERVVHKEGDRQEGKRLYAG